jgi:glycerol-3-phosphate dehydrogenase
MSERELTCDVLVVGGGINGAGIARDAAGRGLSVVLCDQDDLGAHTSSASTKLIHGGLRYLEHYEFGLVRKSLIEREVLLRAAPHIIWPLRFVMPYDVGLRPTWMIRAGLGLYDHLARRELLPGSERIDLRRHPAGEPLRPEFHVGFAYSDGWVDDARLVLLNVIDSAERGAQVLPRARCESAVRKDGVWHAQLEGPSGRVQVHARSLVNAAGPWAASFLGHVEPEREHAALRLVKGSHIVVRRLFAHPFAYIFQHPDKRIVFAIPFERDFTLVGTTDVDYLGDPRRVDIERDEIEYLCSLLDRYFPTRITPEDVVWTYSGVRPLLEDEARDASKVTRDYRLELEGHEAPLLSVFGGKLTTYRKLAEEAVDKLAPLLGVTRSTWTETECLPGGDLFGAEPSNRSVLEFERFVETMRSRYPWVPAELMHRYTRAYGTRLERLLQGRTSLEALGECFAPGLYEAEVRHWVDNEWATTPEDMLWRRSKLGLRVPADTAQRIAQYLGRSESGARAVA